MNETIEQLEKLTADRIMAAMWLITNFNAEDKPAVEERYLERFGVVINQDTLTLSIANYLAFNAPTDNTIVNAYAGVVLGESWAAASIAQKHGSDSEGIELSRRVLVAASGVLKEFSLMISVVQALRAIATQHLAEVMNTDETQAAKYCSGKTVYHNTAGNHPALAYMRHLFQKAEKYVAVCLLPADQDHLDNSYYLTTTNPEDMMVSLGCGHAKQFVSGPWWMYEYTVGDVVAFPPKK